MKSLVYSSEEDKQILKLKAEGYTWEDIGKALNKTREAVRKRYYRIMNTVNAQTAKPKYKSLEEHILAILEKTKNLAIEELQDLTETDTIEEILLALYKLISNGYDIAIHSGWIFYESYSTRNNYIFSKGSEGKLKLAITGDWHIGSKKQQITRLHEFYQLAYDRGIRNVICSGDVFDGTRVFRDQAEEIYLHTVDEQVDYGKEMIPQYDDVDTYLISGNHDHGFGTGFNAVSSLCKQRPDLHYLGKYGAYLTLNGITTYLHHGLGSQSYALSYKLQKFVERIPVGYEPDIVAQAHYHYLFYGDIRGIASFEVGSFQGLTDFARRMGRVYSVIGGWLVEIEKTRDSISIEHSDKKYEEINHDYPFMSYKNKVFYF